jgi:hypothetical protein
MLPRELRVRRSLRAAVVALATAAALAPGAVAGAQPAQRCKSADLRYPFQEGGPKTFGVFRLRIAAGRCATAHRVAKAWMKEFEAELRAGRVQLPRRVAGFTFTSLPPNAAQTYRERGRRRDTTIRFDYRVPNG